MKSIAQLAQLIRGRRAQNAAIAAYKAEQEALGADMQDLSDDRSDRSTNDERTIDIDTEIFEFEDDESSSYGLEETAEPAESDIDGLMNYSPFKAACESDVELTKRDSGIFMIDSRPVSFFSDDFWHSDDEYYNGDDEPDCGSEVHKCETPWSHACLPKWYPWQQGRDQAVVVHFTRMMNKRPDSLCVKRI